MFILGLLCGFALSDLITLDDQIVVELDRAFFEGFGQSATIAIAVILYVYGQASTLSPGWSSSILFVSGLTFGVLLPHFSMPFVLHVPHLR